MKKCKYLNSRINVNVKVNEEENEPSPLDCKSKLMTFSPEFLLTDSIRLQKKTTDTAMVPTR